TIFANDSNGNSNTASTSFDVSEEVTAVGGANIPYITYKIFPAEREPIYIPVKEWPPVEKEIPLKEIEEEEPVKVVVPEKVRPIVSVAPPAEKPSLLVPLGFTLFEALLLFVSLGWFIWRNKKKYYNK
ncbi:MAG: hypothetical protein KAI26_08490, partial [Nanoarchaeota archaeon]|nr:hypothetical protein [Nanoarchaeota archaeon]